MMSLRTVANIVIISMLSASRAFGQERETEQRWSFAAQAYFYFVPDSRDYLQPTVTADRDRLHLEVRYNYEDMQTVSAWTGFNLAGGDKLAWELTPMLGVLLGNTAGVAPGYKGSLSWWKLELYSEGEYVFDAGDASGNFLYNWSELAWAPVEAFRVGFVTQRTRAYETELDIQRGLFAGFTYAKLSLTTYVFNPDRDKPITVVALGFAF